VPVAGKVFPCFLTVSTLGNTFFPIGIVIWARCFRVSTVSALWRGDTTLRPSPDRGGGGEALHHVPAVPPRRIGVVGDAETAILGLVEETGGLGEESPVLGDRARRDPGLLGVLRAYGAALPA
jgi:hypothetical protein